MLGMCSFYLFLVLLGEDAQQSGLRLTRELLLQLPQALPGGLHVPQELGYFIVLGFGELHASRRQEMAELCRSGPEQRGGERREAAHPRSGDRGDGPPGRPLLPAHRSHGAGNCRMEGYNRRL